MVTRPTKWEPAIPGFDKMLHGGDYNPDQWVHEPAVIDEDFRMMPLAGYNIVSIGIFGWASLEPEEGRYTRHPALGIWHLSNEYAGDPCGINR